MSANRQDAWTNDEDLILAEVVLRHIREGSTQLAAFEEVGERLSRTAAACGFRWNSAIRKKYEAAIALAKKQRKHSKQVKKEVSEPVETVEVAMEVEAKPQKRQQNQVEVVEEQQVSSQVDENGGSITMEKVIAFLKNQQTLLGQDQRLQKEKQQLLDENETLRKENARLEKEIKKMRQEKMTIAEDYQTLISIMDRARKLSLVGQENEQAMEK
ncbi:RsfA family transcriptional regulator [Halalkalibacterium halodurans]|uniref:BH2581 protein n=2 Tax=Halalkalibacterium halodurans TaxID=86665 RepID=Q9K9R4_HALH5|nr:RsfA family transcriptional regulator [Halalkalibacterium halodurans]MED3647276.1 RsfA family transcriptional regulator [Halalkalibacterium halodurans]MED4079725.1 RsfA family transcriptional regulator [Halalkalibacterium halodurans]MED4086333.1 RsfA family transcriptional regulator [Halalkalibacterium halodurans]MED4103322.1 RsfA family transcriptional regulator [Halalkalibacterium halodurans]MED4107981.1 RsfA family transcriptional regulator [Halalkalibacterium halodurans]